MPRESKGIYRGKYVFKGLFGKWMYIDKAGKGHFVARKYYDKIKPIDETTFDEALKEQGTELPRAFQKKKRKKRPVEE
jgi:hypothetical protein